MLLNKRAAASTGYHSRLKIAAETGWPLLAILALCIINLRGRQPFELPKVVLLRTLVWLPVGLPATRYFLTCRSARCDLQAIPLLGAVGTLALAIIVTTLTAVTWRSSLWGSYRRTQGAITLLTYLILFVLTTTQFRLRCHACRMIAIMAASANGVWRGLLAPNYLEHTIRHGDSERRLATL